MIIFEVFPVKALGGDGLFQIFHTGQIVLDTNLVELLDDVGLDADAHVLAALNEQRLVDQIAQSIFLAVFNGNLQLLGSAAILAILLGIFCGGGASLVEFGAGDDFVVHAGDDFFDDATGIGIGGSRFCAGGRGLSSTAGFGAVSGVSGAMPGFSRAGVDLSCRGRLGRRSVGGIVVLCGSSSERQSPRPERTNKSNLRINTSSLV